MIVAEVAAAPAAEAAVALTLFVAYIVALGMLWVWRSTLGAIMLWLADQLDGFAVNVGFKTVHLFGPVASALRTVDDTVRHGLGVAATNTERGATWLFHVAAKQLTAIGDAIGGLAWDVYDTLRNTATVTVPNAIYRAQHATLTRIHAVEAAIASAESELTARLRRGIDSTRRELAQDYERLRRGIDRAQRDALAAVAGAAAAIDLTVGRTWKQISAQARRISHLEALLGAVGAAALVGRALVKLELSWIRCPSLARIGKNVGCAPWRLLEDVFMGSFAILAATDLCRWATLTMSAAEQARPLFLKLVDVENALIGCHGNVAPAPLKVVASSPTPIVDPVGLAGKA